MDSPGTGPPQLRDLFPLRKLLLIDPHPQWALVIGILNALNHCHRYGLAAKIQLIGLEEDLPGNHN